MAAHVEASEHQPRPVQGCVSGMRQCESLAAAAAAAEEYRGTMYRLRRGALSACLLWALAQITARNGLS